MSKDSRIDLIGQNGNDGLHYEENIMSDDKEDNVVDFTGTTTGEVPVEKVLKGAEEAELDDILLLGWSGDDLYIASSGYSRPALVYLLELAKAHYLNDALYGGEE